MDTPRSWLEGMLENEADSPSIYAIRVRVVDGPAYSREAWLNFEGLLVDDLGQAQEFGSPDEAAIFLFDAECRKNTSLRFELHAWTHASWHMKVYVKPDMVVAGDPRAEEQR